MTRARSPKVIAKTINLLVSPLARAVPLLGPGDAMTCVMAGHEQA